MQRHRFYAPPAQRSDSHITLIGAEAHHLSRVLRLGAGARVFVFDGQGAEFECEVRTVSNQTVALAIVACLEHEVESPLRLTLAQALIKGDKFDWVVQKATELGVTRIAPLITEHSESRRMAGRTEHRLQRWQRIALAAVTQCGRRRLVEIAEPAGFTEFCETDESETKLILSERGGRTLREIAEEISAPPGTVTLAIAPEGGWHEAELNIAAQHGFIPLYLGTRILRTETAAIAAVTLAQHLCGDIR